MSKEHAYAYEAGYRDGSIHYELEHCPACKNVADLQEALAENVKLREDLEFERSENGWAREFLNRMGQKCGTKDCPSLVAYVTNLEAENAKLRELIRELFRDFANADYELKSRCGRTFMAVTRYLPRLQELEVEP